MSRPRYPSDDKQREYRAAHELRRRLGGTLPRCQCGRIIRSVRLRQLGYCVACERRGVEWRAHEAQRMRLARAAQKAIDKIQGKEPDT
ncbi:hypothetical protein [Gloeobacter morelensis]|uniref:hypothetical protein n=1 Tax=Gloeobacter morelensis TaxID=2907343 RepID=UPI001E481DA1|nr:hypothetical protein [Gloeobacter morelensis]UFP97277.1 hypothetical protein ISF26_24455 [Gloeobacter morelensis MG652769]